MYYSVILETWQGRGWHAGEGWRFPCVPERVYRELEEERLRTVRMPFSSQCPHSTWMRRFFFSFLFPSRHQLFIVPPKTKWSQQPAVSQGWVFMSKSSQTKRSQLLMWPKNRKRITPSFHPRCHPKSYFFGGLVIFFWLFYADAATKQQENMHTFNFRFIFQPCHQFLACADLRLDLILGLGGWANICMFLSNKWRALWL